MQREFDFIWKELPWKPWGRSYNKFGGVSIKGVFSKPSVVPVFTKKVWDAVGNIIPIVEVFSMPTDDKGDLGEMVSYKKDIYVKLEGGWHIAQGESDAT